MKRSPPTLDMRIDGSFTAPQRQSFPLSLKLMIGAIVVALIGGAVAIAALAVWLFAMLLPVILGAAAFAWATMKYRQWQASRHGRTLRPF